MLAIFKDGTFYTTSFDVSNRYQGDILRIEKFDADKTFTALYYDAKAKAFYVKRFSFFLSDNTPVSFIAEGQKSYLVDISDDLHPQFQVTFAGKYAHRDPEIINAEEYIAKKGLTAKGKRCHAYDVKKVRFIEPLVKEGDPVPGEEQPEGPEPEGMPQEEPAAEAPAEEGTGPVEPVQEEPAQEAPKPAKKKAAARKKTEAKEPEEKKPEEPMDILEGDFNDGGAISLLPDIDDIPDIGDIEEPTLF